ncbi:MAG: dihydroorotate dehydrogenase electron transfer subunit [Paludibacteraceae bacterium]|nr:dihydroorotate dehydrogenase electron transfer subunit [Paludibacteraceae bacterium]
MIQDTNWKILSNEALTEYVWQMRLAGDTTGMHPGQFVEISLPGLFLRRPISICDSSDGVLTIVYKVVGKGTLAMTNLMLGQELKILAPLGNGYDLDAAGDAPLLVGGGVGVPPMYMLAKTLREKGKHVNVILGFNTASEVFYAEKFQALGCQVTITTADGTMGVQGFVTNALPDKISYFYACGPLPMLRALCSATEADGEMSFEERMGCGFGVCMGCSIQTKNGNKRVCKDGPVFKKGEVNE